MFGRKKLYASVLTTGVILLGIGNAWAIETKARNAILMDYDTGQYLYVKEHEKMVAPASMSKLMTVNMIFEKGDNEFKNKHLLTILSHSLSSGNKQLQMPVLKSMVS